jgi:branched-chain amino acid transport system ATP-binding protein
VTVSALEQSSTIPMLEVFALSAGYGQLNVLHDVSLAVASKSIVALLGPNGASKSTLLRAVAGLIKPTSGRVLYCGADVTSAPTNRLARLGLVLVPEGRAIFAEFTVEENLRIGGYVHRSRQQIRLEMDEVFGLFPALWERRRSRGGTLSGGEQQMLAIGRALMSRPRLLMLDEPSLGLAPQMVNKIMTTIVRIRDDLGVSVLLVEQNSRVALEVGDEAYILHSGAIVAHDTVQNLRANDDIRRSYLGVSSSP